MQHVRRSSVPRATWREHRDESPTIRAPDDSPPADIVLQKFRVCHSHVNVRDQPSTSGRIVAIRLMGEVFEADQEQDGWVRSTARFGSAYGWLLVNGRTLGLGQLLERITSSSPSTVATKTVGVDKILMPLILRPPKPVLAGSTLPPGTCGR